MVQVPGTTGGAAVECVRKGWTLPAGFGSRAWPVAQPRVSVLGLAPLPLVERFPRDSESTARPRDIARRLGMLQYFRPPSRDPQLLCLRHRVSTLGLRAVKGERNASP